MDSIYYKSQIPFIYLFLTVQDFKLCRWRHYSTIETGGATSPRWREAVPAVAQQRWAMWRPLWSSPSMFWMWHWMVVVSSFYIIHNPIGRIGHSQVNWASISKSTIKMSPAWAKLWQLWSCLNSHNTWSGPIDDSCRLRPVLPNDLSQSKSTHYHL